jgi:hypothetical protein
MKTMKYLGSDDVFDLGCHLFDGSFRACDLNHALSIFDDFGSHHDFVDHEILWTCAAVPVALVSIAGLCLWQPQPG